MLVAFFIRPAVYGAKARVRVLMMVDFFTRQRFESPPLQQDVWRVEQVNDQKWRALQVHGFG